MEAAPALQGMVQVKIARGLVEYPRGKSAMVRYAACSDLRAWLCAQRAGLFERAAAVGLEGPLSFRVCITLDPEALDATLGGQFIARFGRRPRLDS